MTTRTFTPSCAPESHLCEEAPTHSGRGIHQDTGCIYHPSCLSRPMMTRSELIPSVYAVRKQRAAFSISGGQS